MAARPNFLHLHAKGIACRAFNTPKPTDAELRFIYRLASEVPESGRTIAAWENDFPEAESG